MKDFRMFIQTMITLASASLGLVAALAWNEAIKETIAQVLGKRGGLGSLHLCHCRHGAGDCSAHGAQPDRRPPRRRSRDSTGSRRIEPGIHRSKLALSERGMMTVIVPLSHFTWREPGERVGGERR